MKSKIIGLIIGVFVLGGLMIASFFNSTQRVEQPANTTTVATTSTSTTPTSSYTQAQVAVHGDSTSCWSIVNNNVYDLTDWINKHPGGDQAILGMCGKDATDAFERQHGGNTRPEQILATFFIGVLIK